MSVSFSIFYLSYFYLAVFLFQILVFKTQVPLRDSQYISKQAIFIIYFVLNLEVAFIVHFTPAFEYGATLKS